MVLSTLNKAVERSGLIIVEMPNWQTRGRPSGGFYPSGVLCHHTGSYDGEGDTSSDKAYADWMARVGRSDLPAPLCHLALSAESVVYVCAAGRANHGGTARTAGPMPSGDANYMYIGIEAMNSGSQGWGTKGKDREGNTITQYEGYTRLVRSLVDFYDWPVSHVRAHRETSVTGKWDPGLLDMDKFRTSIANCELEDDEMKQEDWTKLREVVGEVVENKLNAQRNEGVKNRSDDQVVKELHQKVTRIEAAVNKLAKDG